MKIFSGVRRNCTDLTCLLCQLSCLFTMSIKRRCYGLPLLCGIGRLEALSNRLFLLMMEAPKNSLRLVNEVLVIRDGFFLSGECNVQPVGASLSLGKFFDTVFTLTSFALRNFEFLSFFLSGFPLPPTRQNGSECKTEGARERKKLRK